MFIRANLSELYILFIRESVDSLCRDGADALYDQQYSVSAQKPRGRQLTSIVCGSESAIFLILIFLILILSYSFFLV